MIFLATTAATGQISNLPLIGTSGQVLQVNAGSDGLEYTNPSVNVLPTNTLPIGFNADGTNNLLNGSFANLTVQNFNVGGVGAVLPGVRFYNRGTFVPAVVEVNSRIDYNITKADFVTGTSPGEHQMILTGFDPDALSSGSQAILNLTTSGGQGIFNSATVIFVFTNDTNVDDWLASIVTVLNGESTFPYTASLVDNLTDTVTLRFQWPTAALVGSTIVRGPVSGTAVNQVGLTSVDITNGVLPVASSDTSQWI